MNTPNPTKVPIPRLTLKRLVIGLLLVCLTGFFIFNAFLAVGLGNFVARESGGLNAFQTIFGAIVGGLFITVLALSTPIAASQGEFEYGAYATYQLWLLLGVCSLTAIMLVVFRARLSTWAVTLLVAYVLTILATNNAAGWFRVDHSHDFPIGRAINSLDWRNNPTESDIIAKAGEPLARREFEVGDPALPSDVSENMRSWKQSKSLFLAYHENESFGRETTYYVMIDPLTKKVISRIAINRPISDKWPNLVK